MIERAREIGGILTRRLGELQEKDARIGDIRGHGAMIAAEFVDPETKAPDAALTAAVDQLASPRPRADSDQNARTGGSAPSSKRSR